MTPPNLHTSCCQTKHLCRCFVTKCRMVSFLIIKTDPISNNPVSLFYCSKVVMPDTLLFDSSEKSLDHTVLFRSIRGDKLLNKVVVFYSLGERSAAKDQSIVTSKSNVLFKTLQLTETIDQSFLQSCCSSPGFTTFRESVSLRSFWCRCLSRRQVYSTHLSDSTPLSYQWPIFDPEVMILKALL